MEWLNMRVKESVANRVIIQEGDITTLAVDAIVNAANSSLMGGGGVDGAIHRAAGRLLLEECRRLRQERYPDGLPTGKADLTKGYSLPSRFVIHTVGPIWRDGMNGEADLLRHCYQNVLEIASANQFKTIAIPAISTGIYGYPKRPAANIAIRTTLEFLAAHTHPQQVIFILPGENYKIHREVLTEMLQELRQNPDLVGTPSGPGKKVDPAR